MIDAARKLLGPIATLDRRAMVGVGMLAAIVLSEAARQISYLT